MIDGERLGIEKSICECLVDTLLAAGFTITVNDGEEDVTHDSTDRAEIVAAMYSTDEDYLHVRKESIGGWFRLIYGNGPDVISDFTTNLTEWVKPAEAFADRVREGEWRVRLLEERKRA